MLDKADKQKYLTTNGGGEALNFYRLEEEGGTILVAENASYHQSFLIEADGKSKYDDAAVDLLNVSYSASDQTTGFLSSRGAYFCQDVVPPRHR